MLMTSNLIDGKQAQTLNAICKEFAELKPQYDDMKKVIDKQGKIIKEILKEENSDGGVYETTKFVCKMTCRQGSVTISAKEVEEKAPALFQKLVELDLVKIGNPTYALTDVKAKV